MRCPKWITAQDIDRWAPTPQARTLLPDLLRRLVYATVPRQHLGKIDFPAGPEIQRPGYDGTTVTTTHTPFVPTGVCFWEISCDSNPDRKAQTDYSKRIKEYQERQTAGNIENIGEATYIAVTALDWQKSKDWAKKCSAEKHFREVLAYDSNDLEHWIQDAPAVGLWLSQQIDGKCEGVLDLATHWENVQATLRHRLPAKVLLVNRDNIGTSFSKWLSQPNGELAVKAPSPAEVVAVFSAWVFSQPLELQESILSRAIIVEKREAWRALATSQQPLILIASPRLEADAELFAEAVRQNHHVLRFADFRTPRSSGATELGIMRRFDLQTALQEAGIHETEASQLAEAAGGNFTILQRRLARSASPPPVWANDNDLAALLLAASWEDKRHADQEVISRLADKSYPDCHKLMTKWRQATDSPVRLTLGTWEFLSPTDAWENLHPLLGTFHLDRFQQVAVEVLSEENPALDLPPDQRIMASVKGKVWRFSPMLRRGIAEILALGATREQDSCIGTELQFAARAAFIVRAVLPSGCSWKRWASLGEIASLLVEVAPDVALEAMELDLKTPEHSQLIELLRQEVPGGITGAAYHCGVLWALETIAWSPEHFKRVSLILTKLTALDPGGTWSNRPLASIGRVFFSKWPQTMASFDERIVTLKYLVQKEPHGALKLIISLLPGPGGIVMANAKPSYRNWAAGWTGAVTHKEYDHLVSQLADSVMSLVEASPDKWPELLDHIGHLNSDGLNKIRTGLEQICNSNLSIETRKAIWEKLRKIVQDHTYFHDAWWVLPKCEIEKFSALRDRFAPDDLVAASVYLFADDGHMDGGKAESYEKKRERRFAVRRTTLLSIWKTHGLPAILELAKQVRQPWAVGVALAQELGGITQPFILPSFLTDENKSVQHFARTFAAQRISTEGRDWAEALPNAAWTPAQIAAFAVQMVFDSRTWDWTASKGEETERMYWSETVVWGGTNLSPAESERVVKSLQNVGRPWSALEHLMLRLHDKQTLSPEIVCEALEAIATNPERNQPHSMDAYHIQEAFKFLQNHQDSDEIRVARMEFAFLNLLDRHTLLPGTLQRILAKDPEFFVECLKILYRPRHSIKDGGEEEKPAVDSATALKAERIWHLLRDWQVIPGAGKEGISLDGLRSWVHIARQKASEADRLEVCDLTIGELFARSGEDVDKAKPAIAIREIMEECESEELERGFGMGLENLRGVYSKSLYEGGKQERELASRYEQYSKICSKWPRVAAVLRSVSEDYLRQAEREDERAAARD